MGSNKRKLLHSNTEFECYDIFHTSTIYCNDRFSTSVFSARDTLKMQRKLNFKNIFSKRTLPATKQIQTKISSFLKPTKWKENNNEVIYL